ncbi:MAG: sugar-binding domain-containing protein [Acidobacteriota bacterium]
MNYVFRRVKLFFVVISFLSFFIQASSFLTYSEEVKFIDISKEWKFQIDPDELGIKNGWFKLNFDDSEWKILEAGKIWENQGFEEYDGTGWYRKSVIIPEGWKGNRVYIGFGGVDDEYELFINSKKVAAFGSKEEVESFHNRSSSTDITEYVKFGASNLIVLRINDWGGGGGISKLPAGLSIERELLLDPREYVIEKSKKYPDLFWPYWVQGKGIAWTMVGTENTLEEFLRSHDGSVGATTWPFTLNCWVMDGENNKVVAPEKMPFDKIKSNLYGGYIPISEYSFKLNEISLKTSFFSADIDKDLMFKKESGIYQILIENPTNKTKKIKIFVSIRPYLVNGNVGKVHKLEWDKESNSIIINDNLSISSDVMISGFYASSIRKENDISKFILDGNYQEKLESKIEDETGMANGFLLYNLSIPPKIIAKINVIGFFDPHRFSKEDFLSLKEIDFEKILQNLSSSWENRLKKAKIEIADKRVIDAFYASLAYILISMDNNMPHPGPLAYNLFWARDSAYITAALLRAGFSDVVEKSLPYYMKSQKEDGEFPSIFDINLKSVGPHEWDAQGQAIFSLAEYYRFTKNKDYLKNYFQNVLKGCQFLGKIREKNLDEKLRETFFYGILPPSVSAEDLGPGTWHHYWDDFWAIRGLYDGAYLAKEIGKKEESKWMKHEAENLKMSVKASYEKIMREKEIDWIPNGPDDLEGSSMARGTSPGLWPGGGLSPEDEKVRKSFERYHEKWIAPYGGAYLHQNRFWPYGFELGYCFLILGMNDKVHQIIDWHLNHQTFPENYSWAEQIDPKTLYFQSGDMPHCWVAADYVNLVRALFLREDEEKLILCSGIKEEWFQNGNKINIENLPSYFGNLSYYLGRKDEERKLILKIEGNAQPPSGYKLIIPFKDFEIKKVFIDGKELKEFKKTEVHFPAGSKEILIYY